jgi:hypothetical protein
VAFSPDSQTLATADQWTVALWRTTDGEDLGTLEGYSQPVRWLSFARGGEALVALRGHSRAGFEHRFDFWVSPGQ